MRIPMLVLLLALAACSTPGTLAYAPPTTPNPGPKASVAAVTVVDRRDEKPNRLATIRGGYGNPLKVLDTPVPVSDVVAGVFTAALQQRQMLAAGAPYRFQVTLNALYGDQFMGRRAEIKMDLAVFDGTNRLVYNDTVNDGSYVFTFFDNGVFAGMEDLRLVVEKLLTQSVDRMLDKRRLFDVLVVPPGVGLPRS